MISVPFLVVLFFEVGPVNLSKIYVHSSICFHLKKDTLMSLIVESHTLIM